MFAAAIYLLVIGFIFYLCYDFCRYITGRDIMLRELRHENTQLMHKRLDLEEENLQLKRMNDMLIRQLTAVETKPVEENNYAEQIIKLEAELRTKDMLLEQKWNTARAAWEVANG